MLIVEFEVVGKPEPGGSKRAFHNAKTGKTHVVDDNDKVMPWRDSIVTAAMAQYNGPLVEAPLSLEVTFRLPRPKGHFGSGKKAGELKEKAPIWHTKKPDRTKLLRALEDALTGVIWRDDTQIVSGNVIKRYAGKDERPGATVVVRTQNGVWM